MKIGNWEFCWSGIEFGRSHYLYWWNWLPPELRYWGPECTWYDGPHRSFGLWFTDISWCTPWTRIKRRTPRMYRITRGSLRDLPLRNNLHREGWWWHSSGTPEGWDYGYAPEGPFISKAYAIRHLRNTLRLARIAEKRGRWPKVPDNAGWAPNWGGRIGKPKTKPLKGTKLFGLRYRNYLKES